jgi:hypothetical protein
MLCDELESALAQPETKEPRYSLEEGSAKHFAEALEVVALASYETDSVLPEDLDASEYAERGLLECGRDEVDEGYCRLSKAGKEFVRAALSDARWSLLGLTQSQHPDSEGPVSDRLDGGEVLQYLDEHGDEAVRIGTRQQLEALTSICPTCEDDHSGGGIDEPATGCPNPACVGGRVPGHPDSETKEGEREIDAPDQHGVTPADEAVVEDAQLGERCGGSGEVVTGECRVAMSGPTCMNPDCPPCQTPETEPRPDCEAREGAPDLAEAVLELRNAEWAASCSPGFNRDSVEWARKRIELIAPFLEATWRKRLEEKYGAVVEAAADYLASEFPGGRRPNHTADQYAAELFDALVALKEVAG